MLFKLDLATRVNRSNKFIDNAVVDDDAYDDGLLVVRRVTKLLRGTVVVVKAAAQATKEAAVKNRTMMNECFLENKIYRICASI